jgi:hypothetical protein
MKKTLDKRALEKEGLFWRNAKAAHATAGAKKFHK